MNELNKGTIYSVSGSRAQVLVQGEAEPSLPSMICPAGTRTGDVAVVAKVNGGYMILQTYRKEQ